MTFHIRFSIIAPNFQFAGNEKEVFFLERNKEVRLSGVFVCFEIFNDVFKEKARVTVIHEIILPML